jgi:thiosulfate reductase cytochrome b subunit
MTDATPQKKPQKKPIGPKQAAFVKLTHGMTIVSLVIMIGSGLRIYNANPVFGGRGGWVFPKAWVLGGGLSDARNWHFAAMWFFSINLLIYGLYIFITKRWEKRFLSAADVKALKESQNAKRKNYAWHRLVYTGIVPVLLLAIVSGIAMYKPAQFDWLGGLFINWQVLRTVHFVTVPIVLVFTIAHAILGMRVGTFKLIRSMFI